MSSYPYKFGESIHHLRVSGVFLLFLLAESVVMICR